MAKNYYPVYLDLEGEACLVVGGGTIAQRKVEGLLTAGANVTVIAPDTTGYIAELAARQRIRWIRAAYQTGRLEGMRLVIGATDNPTVNERVFLDARAAGIPVNIVDDPDHCTFIVPAIWRKGDIVAAVGTGGGAPGVSSRLRDEIGTALDRGYDVLVATLKSCRERIKALPLTAKKRFRARVRALDIDFYRNRPDELRDTIARWVVEARREAAQ